MGIDLDVIRLNDRSLDTRIAAVEVVGDKIRRKVITRAKETLETNNHIHTMFSFCPYFPTYAAYLSWIAGLQTCGSTDHDSFSAAKEMKIAGNHIGIGTTVGFELRVDFSEFGFANRRINNPDTLGNAYVVAHGIPIIYADKVSEWLKPINAARNLRNQKMVLGLNSLLSDKGIKPLDFNLDVYDASQAKNGGSITERHILYALSQRIIGITNPNQIVSYLEQDLIVKGIPAKLKGYLSDGNNPHRAYDLLGILKSSFLPGFYIQPNGDECIPGSRFLRFVESIQGISTYAYLGDVTASPTGDKKAEKFEDEYLDELMPVIVDAGFLAIAYMIPRNDGPQRKRIRNLCERYNRMEINGVDINSSRQDFNCHELALPEWAHLGDSAWALVGHESEINNGRTGLSLGECKNKRDLTQQIEHYARIGRYSVQV